MKASSSIKKLTISFISIDLSMVTCQFPYLVEPVACTITVLLRQRDNTFIETIS